MLTDESTDILRWSANGHAFEIHDMQRMMDIVLPKYFKHQKYTSFQRQLNYFNFKKWTKSKAIVCTFSNEFFVRDNELLAIQIMRKKSSLCCLKVKRRSVGHGRLKKVMVAGKGNGGNVMAIRAPEVKEFGNSGLSPTEVMDPLFFTDNLNGLEALDWIDQIVPNLEQLDGERVEFPFN